MQYDDIHHFSSVQLNLTLVFFISRSLHTENPCGEKTFGKKLMQILGDIYIHVKTHFSKCSTGLKGFLMLSRYFNCLSDRLLIFRYANALAAELLVFMRHPLARFSFEMLILRLLEQVNCMKSSWGS